MSWTSRWPIIIGLIISVTGILSIAFLPNLASAIIALTAALLTFIYVVLTWAMVRNLAQSTENEWRPWLFPSIREDVTETSGGGGRRRKVDFSILIKNYGRFPAIDVYLECEPEVDTEDGPLSRQLSVFAPDSLLVRKIKKIRKPESEENENEKNTQEFIVTLSYTWPGENKSFSQSFRIMLDEPDPLKRIANLVYDAVSRGG